MIINPTFSFAAGTTSTDVAQFEGAVNTVIAQYEQIFRAANVTLNIDYAYGEYYLSSTNTQIIFQNLPNANAGGFDLGRSESPFNSFNYTMVADQLKRDAQSANQANAYATLPTNSPFNSSVLWVTNAQQKALGLTGGGNTLAGFDGVVGIISNEELAAGGDSADWTAAAPANANQFYMLGSIEHETSEVMGRISWDGTNAINNTPTFTIMDLFRYSAVGVRDAVPDINNNTDAYFSIDNGATLQGYWNNVYRNGNPNGDLGDWATGKPGTAPANFPNNPIGNDAFLNTSSPGVINGLSATDQLLMNILGWDVPNPAPPAATTADMILRHASDGMYEIYDIGSNGILGGYPLGQVGTDWQFAGLGDFSGSDTTDMMLRNANTGTFEVYDISNNNITFAASLGAVGLNWRLAGFGNFNGAGATTDMMLRDGNTGTFELYDIGNNMITGANAIGAVGLDWRVAGFGDFNDDGTTDMMLRNTSSGSFEVYDIVGGQLVSATSVGAVGNDWQVAGFADFSGPGTTTGMMLRNTATGVFELYNISNNMIASASAIGAVGLDWQVAGFGPLDGAGSADMVLRNINSGAFEVYDIVGGRLAGAAPLGAVGLDWQLGGFAADPLTQSATIFAH